MSITYIKRTVYIGVIALIITGIFTRSAAALSMDELLARITELTAQVDMLMKQLSTVKEIPKIGTFSYNLQLGMKRNTEVRKLQQFLIDGGYLRGTGVTGNFLNLTKGAVQKFQAAKGLPVTGVFDKQTRDVVNVVLKNIGSIAVTATTTPTDETTILIKTATSTVVVQATTTTPQTPLIIKPTIETYHIDARPTFDISAIERATFDSVNSERQKNGLSALQWNDQLANIARAHSGDQAGDNTKITNPEVACLYPYIRHEGFVAGFKIGERLDGKNIFYSIAGENIIILPITKELIYRAEKTAPACGQFTDMEGPIGETRDAAQIRVQKSLFDRSSLMIDQQKLNWVNKQWKSVAEIANESATDWMNSPGHRHNILTSEFQEGAIGAAIVNDYIIMTQIFLKKQSL